MRYVVLPASSSALARIAMDLPSPRGHCGRTMLFDDDAGVLEHDLKELTRAYVAYTVECGY